MYRHVLTVACVRLSESLTIGSKHRTNSHCVSLAAPPHLDK